jgi:UDP-glucose 4-epimerase
MSPDGPELRRGRRPESLAAESQSTNRGRVLLTGATGFIGRGLVPVLSALGYRVRAAMRSVASVPDEVESAVVGDLRRPINLSEALREVDYVVHSAGIAHSDESVAEGTYREVNAGTTAILAKAARQAGVRRFVLLSSVRAQVGPSADEVVTEALPARPTDAYGRSKLEAEQLLSVAGTPFVVLRPVLVHGPGMRFNMAALMQLARSRWPLPLAGFSAKRSIVARDHLADAVALALSNAAMEGGVFLVSDPEALSVGEMVSAMRSAWGRRPGIFPLPPMLAGLGGRIAGRGEQVERSRKGLIVDPAKLLAAGWRPRRSAYEALAETARRSM